MPTIEAMKAEVAAPNMDRKVLTILSLSRGGNNHRGFSEPDGPTLSFVSLLSGSPGETLMEVPLDQLFTCYRATRFYNNTSKGHVAIVFDRLNKFFIFDDYISRICASI